MFEDLEFIGPELQWQPVTTGNEMIDYLYGYECAYRYSEVLAKAIVTQTNDEVMRHNELFRASIDLATPEGQGFQDGIIGRPSRFQASND